MTKTTNWDAVVASAPLNADAAKALNAVGESFVPRREVVNETAFRSDVPPQMRRLPPDAPNLAGMKVGKLTVIGLAAFGKGGKNRRAAWVVRCACGWYETRSAKVLRDPAYAARAMCGECDYVRQIASGEKPPPKVEIKMNRF